MESFCEEETLALWGSRSSTKDAFEAIVKRHMKDAYFIALGLVGNHDDALELSQEAFFRAFKNIKQLSSKGKFFPWFYQILRNLCFSHLRKRRVRRADSLEELDGDTIQANVSDVFDPEMVAERNESKDRVWKAIARLDDKHREVIVLRHFQNLSYEEISKILFCNRGTVTSRLYYARKRLKEILDREKGGRQ
ncbi:MAG: RNA polymerase sigma factor [Phycisphaerales bacterium]|nr:MAG: RNA polymerase sigma factor [Phycisphaerales bacterium]